MRDLRSYLMQPFENLEASKENICLFFENHEKSLIYEIGKGLPFGDLQQPTTDAVVSLRINIGDTSTRVSQQKSTTFTADECIDLFVAFAKNNEASVRDKFPKNTATYLEFYPNGMKPFNNISKKSVNALMSQFLSAFENHTNELGNTKFDDLKKICDNYVLARSNQVSKKTETKDKRSLWDDCLETMKDQAFVNLLTIAKYYRGKPEKLSLFFDTSIITPHTPKPEGESGYILSIPALKTKAADISFSPDDSLLISNNGSKPVYFFASPIADAAEQANMTEIAAGDQAEVSALALGAPVNKFLIFVNKDTTEDAEVEIILL